MTDISPDDRSLLIERLGDPAWRLSNLYKIVTKGSDDDDDLVVTFKPNAAQQRLLHKLHTRNLVLKARQLGFSTLVAITWLDTALFSRDPLSLGIIAHEREAAESIFRDKIIFAYERLPEALREMCPLARKTATQIVFAHNGCSIRVATSMRSGTIHRLHVSEFGKIARKYPAKAKEVVTGSIPAVPTSGIVIIESTAEGQDGYFYDYVQRAQQALDARRHLTYKDYRLHFFAWWQAPEYRLEEAVHVVETDAMREYFARVETTTGCRLDDAQRAWYVTTLESDFAGEAPLMWQEYPSYPDEAFAVSTEGCYYATQLSLARQQGRIGRVPIAPGVPVHTFWDLGRGDMTAIWLMQRVGQEHRFVRYYEASGEDLSHYAEWLQTQRLIYARHWLPHDAAHRRMGQSPDTARTLRDMLRELLPGQAVEVVPQVTNILSGIQATRNALASCWIDEAGCAKGIERLGAYRKEWDARLGRWKDRPLHDDASHGADAFRQFGQLLEAGETFGAGAYSSAPGATARPAWRAPRKRTGGRAGMSA